MPLDEEAEGRVLPERNAFGVIAQDRGGQGRIGQRENGAPGIHVARMAELPTLPDVNAGKGVRPNFGPTRGIAYRGDCALVQSEQVGVGQPFGCARVCPFFKYFGRVHCNSLGVSRLMPVVPKVRHQ